MGNLTVEEIDRVAEAIVQSHVGSGLHHSIKSLSDVIERDAGVYPFDPRKMAVAAIKAVNDKPQNPAERDKQS